MNMEANPNSELQTPNASIDVAAIERELTELWKNAGEDDGHGGVLRACVLNLLVYLPGHQAVYEVGEVLTEVTAAYPSRAIVMVADREEESSISAWVTSRCTLPTATSKQVCCEQVTIMADGEQVNEMPSAVAPLLLSDLPVYLWWRAVPPLADKVFKRLTGMADRVIIDSACFADPHGDLVSLAVLLRDASRRAATSDLNWARLTEWRALLASFYDIADYRSFLGRLDRISIEYAPLQHNGEVIPPRALLLAGWLASRLGWQLNDDRVVRQGAASICEMTIQGRSAAIEFTPATNHEIEPGHIACASLKIAGDVAASFSVKKSADGHRLETEVILGGERRIGRVLGYRNLSESILIGRELEILGSDYVYEQAVIAAGEMVLALIQA
jgi:glucose-6-phosphate dehydrogenase assembly protein OpcA